MRPNINTNVRRSVSMVGGPVNIVVPAGQVWSLLDFILTTLVTAAQYWYVAVDGKFMWWGPGEADFDPSLGFLAVPGVFPDKDLINCFQRRLPILAVEGQTITIGSTDNSGVVNMHYIAHSLDSGLNSQSDGGTESKKRVIISHSRQVTNVGIGATVDIPIITNTNPPGETVFPWAGNVPPQRKYWLLAYLVGITNVVGTNLARNGLRVLHEGRELVSAAGLVEVPATVCPFVNVGYLGTFWPDPHEINSFEQVQVFNRVTSTDAAAQNATLKNAFILLEEFLD